MGTGSAAPEPIGLAPGASDTAAGEDEEKYANTNPVVKRFIARLLRKVRASTGGTDGVWVDIGIGEGLALEGMRPHAGTLVGVEYRQDKLAIARQRLRAAHGVQADAGMLPFFERSADVVTCLEVLEHLRAPERCVEELARVCRGHCVVSVPWEPFFRLGNFCRGKDMRRFGNNPDHIQQFRPASLRRLLHRSFGDVTVHTCFPWLVAEARQF